ncbi:hypothetical protein R1flu_007484 [Riccia fluitans]|uniref:Uncharacterized protein n=1 Tax=Riccia fluitans TaxID=41844 RepID=A0ABD1YYZ7_9MARC
MNRAQLPPRAPISSSNPGEKVHSNPSSQVNPGGSKSQDQSRNWSRVAAGDGTCPITYLVSYLRQLLDFHEIVTYQH